MMGVVYSAFGVSKYMFYKKIWTSRAGKGAGMVYKSKEGCWYELPLVCIYPDQNIRYATMYKHNPDS
jgi:hypothetical protein